MSKGKSVCLYTALSLAAGLGAVAEPSLGAAVAPLLTRASDLGPMNAASTVELTVWLNLRNGATLDSTLTAQQNGAAFLTNQQVQDTHAPAAADVAKVSSFLTSHGLSVTGVGPNNLYVKASGSVARIDSAFGVNLHQFELRGTSFHASKNEPNLPASIASLVASVGGLSDLGARPNVQRSAGFMEARQHLVRASDLEGMARKPVPFNAGSDGLIFSAQCFYPTSSVSFTGENVIASYQGTTYGAPPSNTAPGTVGPCGYQPSDIAAAYNLLPAYKAGYDGTGVTVAIVDAFGSKRIKGDLDTFSQAMGLPKAKLQIIGTPTETAFSGDKNAGWADETTLDVEWVHAIAPGAKIVLIVTKTNSFAHLFEGIATAAAMDGVVAISNSWSGPESETDIPTRLAGDNILKLANAQGKAVNFATGDDGNQTDKQGYVDVNYPASSPLATAIGGVSVALDANKNITFQTAWGDNLTEIADTVALGSPPIDPPLNEGFIGGSGGGISNVYAAPAFQRSLGGTRRQLPDISWVADPYTGVEIIETEDNKGDQFVETIGGTSLATPMFSALWGIASQRAGHALGQAAPYLYRLPAGAITDVGATPTSANNVTGQLTDLANGKQVLTASELALPLQGQPTFTSALYNSPFSTRWFVLTFGVDTTLQTGPGWDQATGLGTPNGWNFIQAFAP